MYHRASSVIVGFNQVIYLFFSLSCIAESEFGVVQRTAKAGNVDIGPLTAPAFQEAVTKYAIYLHDRLFFCVLISYSFILIRSSTFAELLPTLPGNNVPSLVIEYLRLYCIIKRGDRKQDCMIMLTC